MVLPELKYDDYYKFMTSFCLIIFIISVGSTTILQKSYIEPNTSIDAKQILFWSMVFYLIVASIAVYFFIDSLKQWRTNQKKLDIKLDAEATISVLEAKKSAAEFEKQVSELAKSESPFNTPLELFEELKREKVRKRLEKHEP